jgi:hypothetical protein
VDFKRQLELSMLDGSSEDLWRIGVELAYTVAKMKFGIEDLLIGEPPSQEEGRGLSTRNRKVIFQARMLDLRKVVAPVEREKTLQETLNQMAAKLNDDFKFTDSPAEIGYAILSYVADEDKSVRIVVLEISKS